MRFNEWLSRVISVVKNPTLWFFFAVAVTGCTTPSIFSPSVRYESKPIVIQTLPFFSQKKVAPAPIPSWRGDWAFRRWRLEEMSAAFFEVKPDLLIAQEVMQRAESLYDADRSILSASSLSGYTWQVAPIEKDPITQEEENAALAFSYPFQPLQSEKPPLVWKWGETYVAAFSLEFQQEPLAVFSWFQEQSTWVQNPYAHFLPLIQEFLRNNHIHPTRILIAGVFAQAAHDAAYQDFLLALQLHDSAENFCEQESQCYTHTPTNKLYATVFGDLLPQRGVRILVPATALVSSSKRNFTQSGAPRAYNQRYGFLETCSTLYAGWVTEIHLPSL